MAAHVEKDVKHKQKESHNTSSENADANSYEKPDMPHTTQEWSKWKTERKARKRKWNETKVLNELEKLKKAEEEKPDIPCDATQPTGSLRSVTIALPGSILDNAQSPELRTYLAGQIARAIVVFKVNEVVVFDETGENKKSVDGEFKGVGKSGHGTVQLARILQYLECPQYLRKSIFPQHRDLEYAGLLNPLDCPHHMRAEDRCQYRDGIVLDKPSKRGSFVNIGRYNTECRVDRSLTAGLRVTVKVDLSTLDKNKIRGTVVSPTTPEREAGLYWGYNVRVADNLSSVFTECPYKTGYDVTIGTSEKGSIVDDFKLPDFRHLLIVFGGLQGLEASVDTDNNLDVDDPSLLFDHYLNTCPGQGSRTIRTEEAILVTMSALRPQLEAVKSLQSR